MSWASITSLCSSSLKEDLSALSYELGINNFFCSSSLKDLSALSYELGINNFFMQLFFERRFVSFKLRVGHQ